MIWESSEVTYAAKVRGPVIASAPRMKSRTFSRSPCWSAVTRFFLIWPGVISAEWRIHYGQPDLGSRDTRPAIGSRRPAAALAPARRKARKYSGFFAKPGGLGRLTRHSVAPGPATNVSGRARHESS